MKFYLQIYIVDEFFTRLLQMQVEESTPLKKHCQIKNFPLENRFSTIQLFDIVRKLHVFGHAYVSPETPTETEEEY